MFPWNGLRHLGDSGNGGTTLKFLSPFLWRAPPLEMRRKCREFFPEHAGKGSLLSRRGLTPLGRLQKYPKIHVSTGEESSGSGTNSTQDLRPQHRREGNPERPPSNSHEDWPFLRPPEQVPEVPVISREHLPQLEKIQEVIVFIGTNSSKI